MIPVRDTIGDPGPVRATLALLVVEVLAFTLGLFDGNFWTFLLTVVGTWLFGSPVERRLGTGHFLLAVAALVGIAGLVAGLIDGDATFILYPPGAVLGLGLFLVALVPSGRILVLSPIPFAMGFYEVPAWIVLAIWTVLAWLAA